VSAIAPRLSYLGFDKKYYLDLGYARSRYGDSNIGNGSLTVQQWTPTLGLGLDSDWLQLRAYDIRFSNALRAQGKSATDALEAKWIHYFQMSRGLMPEQVQLGVLLGKRIYALDSDSASLYNLADMQQGGASIGAQWKLAAQTRLLFQGGHDRYQDVSKVSYTGNYLYLGLAQQW
jgi:hypothetical protein